MADLNSAGAPGVPPDVELRRLGYVRDAMAVAGALANNDMRLAWALIDATDSYEDLAKGLASLWLFTLVAGAECRHLACRVQGWQSIARIIGQWVESREAAVRAKAGETGGAQ